MAANEPGPRRAAVSAERAILAAMLMEPQAVSRAAAILKPDRFYYNAHRYAFRAMCDLAAAGAPIDLVTLSGALEQSGNLDACGGPAAIARIAEHYTGSANLETHARMVREAFAARERQRIGLALANGAAEDPRTASDLLTRLAEIETEARGTEDPSAALAALAMTGSDLVAASLPPLDSWLGDGLLARGQLAFLSGHSGIGKTFLAVQLMSALSFGHSFCGIPTRRARVGFIELEMPWASVQHRLRSLDPARSDLSNIMVLCEPPGAIHVREQATRESLIAFCRVHSLDVLVMDPFNRIHADDENDNSAMGAVLDSLHTINRETGTAILVLHHVRKQPSGGNGGSWSRSESLDAMRGSSRLTNEPATVLTLSEMKGLVRLSFTKVRHAESPPAIYLKRNERGFFDVSADPAVEKDRRLTQLAEMLEKAGPDGIANATAAEILKVSEKTARKYFESLGAKIVPFGRNDRRWVGEQAESWS